MAEPKKLLHGHARALGALLAETGLFRSWALLLPLSITVAGVEMLGLWTVFGLIYVLDGAALGGFAWVEPVAQRLQASPVVALACLVAVAYLLKNALKLLEVAAREKLAADAAQRLSSRLFARYLAAPYTFHLRSHSAELIRDVRDSVDAACYRGLLSSAALGSEAVVVLAIVGFVLLRAPGPTLAASAVVTLATLLGLRLTQRKHGELGERTERVHAEIMKVLQHGFTAIREIKLSGRETYFVEAYGKARGELGRARRTWGTLIWVPRSSVESAFVLGLLTLVLVASASPLAEQRLLPLLGLFAFAGLRLLPSLSTVSYHVGQLRFSEAAIQRVLQRLATVPEDAGASQDTGGELVLPFRDRIELRGVGYTYPDATAPAVADIDLVIRRGESIGIVGPSGAGKSTLLSLIVGLLEPTRGEIRVDGRALTGNRRAFQRRIGYVPQLVFLHHGSIRENVAFGIAPQHIDQAAVERAVRLSQLGPLIERLPHGYDTNVGEHGALLSGGERQRLALARALYHDPDVLVFDEATSALDAQTEQAVAAAIAALEGDKTIIMIAHRMDSVRRCDRVVVMMGGRLHAVVRGHELVA